MSDLAKDLILRNLDVEEWHITLLDKLLEIEPEIEESFHPNKSRFPHRVMVVKKTKKESSNPQQEVVPVGYIGYGVYTKERFEDETQARNFLKEHELLRSSTRVWQEPNLGYFCVSNGNGRRYYEIALITFGQIE